MLSQTTPNQIRNKWKLELCVYVYIVYVYIDATTTAKFVHVIWKVRK